MASLLSGYFSLNRPENTVGGDQKNETKQGVVGQPTGTLSLDMDDEALAKIGKDWIKKWDDSEARTVLEAKQRTNERYYLGAHYTPAEIQSNKRELVDNLIFEAVETFLPVATRENPEPTVETSNDPQARMVAKKVEGRLIDLADTLRLKLKIRGAARMWALYYVGIIKLGWSEKRQEIAVEVKRPQLMIFDPDAITNECEYEGEYIGEYKTESAEKIIQRFPEAADYITKEAKDKMGTKLRYVEFWTPEYVFWQLKDKILGKAKNPHWNYPQDQPAQMSVDEYGMPMQMAPSQTVPGNNHFSEPKIPYAFLSIFNLGKLPFDSTSQIEQVLPQQDLINKRQRQIDRNADGVNGGIAVSGDAFTQEQAKSAADALRKGNALWVPQGDVNTAYKRDMAPALPDYIYQNLLDGRNELRNLFGTTGLSSQGIKSENTVRGKILIKGTDTDRASIVVDHIEQFADYVFNYMVQLMMVYYDTPTAVNKTQGSEMLSSTEMVYPLVVSIKDGSMIPKDRLTKRNEAIDLWAARGIDPLSFCEALDMPNPQEAASKLVLWTLNPQAYMQLITPLAAQANAAMPPPMPTPGAPPGAAPPQNAPQTVEQPQPAPNLLNQVPIA